MVTWLISQIPSYRDFSQIRMKIITRRCDFVCEILLLSKSMSETRQATDKPNSSAEAVLETNPRGIPKVQFVVCITMNVYFLISYKIFVTIFSLFREGEC